ncbi:rhomboid family intramembrane serine protease [Xanthomonas sp. SHU 308]|uniref:rhomboid family intramembrane serine protease n=1 Tax=Xanthomonas sp. SHU 308 TaxID=1591201 RepID=UPI0003620B4C|nr:rhomboid family intramembrane serine protease [Xanthomonas sp. SHU 308]
MSSVTPVNLILIVLTVLVSWAAFNNRRLLDRLILWPPAIDRHKQYDRLVTYGFIHADFPHLLFNMVTLYFFGGPIEVLMERLTGNMLVYPLFYLSALVVSILPSYLKNQKNPNYMSLGASGAVSAVLFAFILMAPWTGIFFFFIPIPIPAILYAVFYVGYSIWMDRRGGDNVNHSAHLAGAAFGVMFLLIMEPSVLQHFLGELANPRFGRG